jgi:hypothetical protein
VDEVLSGERRERVLGVEPESSGGCEDLAAAGSAVGCEAVQDPEVELALRLGQTAVAGGTELGGRDLGGCERCGNWCRQLAWVSACGLDAHFAASISASRTHFSSGWAAAARLLR